jgi:hypothetical protein
MFDPNMSESFQLIDLVSQAGAIRKLLLGKTDSEILAWLSGHGQVDVLPREYPDERQSYRFTSRIGREAIFVFDVTGIRLVGEHTTVNDESSL